MCLSASVRILNLGFSTVTTPTSISEGSKSVDRTVDKHVIAVSTVCSNVQLNFFFTFFFSKKAGCWRGLGHQRKRKDTRGVRKRVWTGVGMWLKIRRGSWQGPGMQGLELSSLGGRIRGERCGVTTGWCQRRRVPLCDLCESGFVSV